MISSIIYFLENDIILFFLVTEYNYIVHRWCTAHLVIHWWASRLFLYLVYHEQCNNIHGSSGISVVCRLTILRAHTWSGTDGSVSSSPCQHFLSFVFLVVLLTGGHWHRHIVVICVPRWLRMLTTFVFWVFIGYLYLFFWELSL